MKYVAISIYLWTFLMACGRLPAAEQPAPRIDEALLPYVLLFEEVGQVHSGHVSVIFGPINKKSDKGTVLAYCYYGINEVVVDPNQWKRLNVVERELLIFHELGHCVLGRLGHDDRINKHGCTVTIMHSQLNRAYKCYLKNRNYYIKELFKDIK